MLFGQFSSNSFHLMLNYFLKINFQKLYPWVNGAWTFLWLLSSITFWNDYTNLHCHQQGMSVPCHLFLFLFIFLDWQSLSHGRVGRDYKDQEVQHANNMNDLHLIDSFYKHGTILSEFSLLNITILLGGIISIIFTY